jgi:hypothetical protein
MSLLYVFSTPHLSPCSNVLLLEGFLLLECVLLQVDTDITRFFPFSSAINRILRWLPQATKPLKKAGKTLKNLAAPGN